MLFLNAEPLIKRSTKIGLYWSWQMWTCAHVGRATMIMTTLALMPSTRTRSSAKCWQSSNYDFFGHQYFRFQPRLILIVCITAALWSWKSPACLCSPQLWLKTVQIKALLCMGVWVCASQWVTWEVAPSKHRVLSYCSLALLLYILCVSCICFLLQH